MRTLRIRRWALIAAALGAGTTVSACGGIPPEPFVVARAASSRPPAAPPVSAESIRPSFDSFVAAHPGGVAVAWAPVGRGEAVQTLGATTDLDAWSTMKVPIAVAALNDAGADGRGARLETDVQAAIRESDNAAASRLWRSLGPRDTAAEKTEAVLRAAGDQRTEVTRAQDGRVAGFGRTLWRLDDSARVAAALPCRADAAFVYDAMGAVIPDHRWGVASLPASSHVKGGWGPSDHGYLVRQLGVVDSRGGSIAVALAVQPQDGRHETATATASDLARWIVGRLGEGDVGTCPGGPPATPTASVAAG